jgi:hypothetical protein
MQRSQIDKTKLEADARKMLQEGTQAAYRHFARLYKIVPDFRQENPYKLPSLLFVIGILEERPERRQEIILSIVGQAFAGIEQTVALLDELQQSIDQLGLNRSDSTEEDIQSNG